ncbi:hypothetical protein GUJ93_ZPchr0007g4636 [Zizania palustris]|uniref:Zinc-ribbon domain-containing protein n=1 Tax=Zizania palustris TaxID=103762 RepID=A0A8J5VSG2_ZIZPA|nr:hypothetical protein GUJ93_ZPchr0007g4636 [Zizania palustris]
MAISDATGVRHVRCPRCHSVLQEPDAPVYLCGGCGISLRAKNRAGNSQEVISGLPPPSKQSGSSDVASTSGSTPDALSTRRQQETDATSQRETDDLVSARKNATEQVRPTEEEEHAQSTSEQVDGISEDHTGGDAGIAPRSAGASDGNAHLSEGRKDSSSTSLQKVEQSRNGQTEPDAAGKKHSDERPQPQHRDVEEVPPSSAQAVDSQPAQAVLKRADDAAAAERKATSPPHGHARQSESLAPLQKRILKTVDGLKDELSELFSKSPRREGYAARDAAMAASLSAIRARRAAVHRPSHTARVGKPRQVPAPRGLPSRRYRRCRADPCCHDAHHGCHHGCCPHHGGKAACSSCRGHCCRPREQEPPLPPRPPVRKEVKRRTPPRNHCRPVLKGAPFIVCSSCFKLVQVPADFSVSTKTVRKLRCGSCSTVLCYSYRDPGSKKHRQYSTDGSEVAHGRGGQARRDPFAFMDNFGHVDVSYSTEDEQPLHVSRNSSFNTVDEIHGSAEATAQQSARLHRLMGYGSASDLLFRQHSPDLYESFDKRTTPAAAHAQYDRKGKGVCVDLDDGDDDSDEECGGAPKRSRVRRPGWPLPGILHKGIPGMGAIKIKS